MFYWLFTEGRALLGGCLAPLLCLTLMAPIMVSAILRAGIQRTSEKEGTSGWKRWGLNCLISPYSWAKNFSLDF
jgi:hypothetical protein